jgi:type III secretion protein C
LLVPAVTTALFSLGYASAEAAVIRWNESKFHYRADGIPLTEFLRDLLATQALAVDVDPDVKGTVRGQFSEPARKTFEKVTSAFGLVWFYDGSVVHVSAGAGMRERIISITPLPAGEIHAELDGLGLRDDRFPLSFSKTAVSVSGPPQYLELVVAAINRLRQRALALQRYDDVVIRIFPLKHALAQDTSYQIGGKEQLIPGIASLLQNMIGGSSVRDGIRERPSRAVPGLRGQGMAGQGYGGTSTRADQGAPGQGEALSRSAETPASEADAARARARIVPDARTNAVIIYDVPGMMKHYADAIALLDKPQDLVEIEAAVIELSEGASEELGVDWNIKGSRGDVLALDLSSTMKNLAAPVALATLVNNASKIFSVRLRALQSTDRARILSRPRILTLNNTEAVIGSQKSRHVKVAGDHQVDLYPISTGLMLRVTPLILRDGDDVRRVRLTIQIDDGGFNADAQTDGIPESDSNFVATQAIVADGESLLIGGYHYSSSVSANAKLPLLGDIPWLGGLFRTRSSAAARSERMFLITPRLVPERVANVSRFVQDKAAGLRAEREADLSAQGLGGLLSPSPGGERP